MLHHATISGGNRQLFAPSGIAGDSTGNIYVGNFNGLKSSVTVYAPSSNGNVAPIAVIAGPNTGVTDSNGEAIGPDGALYVANESNTVTIFPHGANVT